MSLTGVKMSEEVWLICLTHALSTETEEIMGLLLGDIQLKVLAEEARTLGSELSRETNMSSTSSPRSPSQLGTRTTSFGHRDLYPPDVKGIYTGRGRHGS